MAATKKKMMNSIDVHNIEEEDAIEGVVVADPSGIRVSAATSQRLKTISSYTEKLHADIRLLTDVRESLNVVKDQLEKEKVDMLNSERISKNALTYVQNNADRALFGAFVDQMFPLLEAAAAAGKTGLENPDVPKAGTSAPALDVGPNELLKLLAGPSENLHLPKGLESGVKVEVDMDESLLDIVEKGLNEPDLPFEDSEPEDELPDLEIKDARGDEDDSDYSDMDSD